MEETVGFEPTELLRPAVFKTAALDPSATSPFFLRYRFESHLRGLLGEGLEPSTASV